tara:strand:- start:194 stop:466 length:273 start_codon:yes stop_codon:yes gene_type:complete
MAADLEEQVTVQAHYTVEEQEPPVEEGLEDRLLSLEEQLLIVVTKGFQAALHQQTVIAQAAAAAQVKLGFLDQGISKAEQMEEMDVLVQS